MTRAPKHSTLQSLLRMERSAEKQSWPTAARMPLNLLAQMHMPIPVPQTRMPRVPGAWRALTIPLCIPMP